MTSKRVPSKQDAIAFINASKYGVMPWNDRGGPIPLTSLFSTEEFQKQMIGRVTSMSVSYIYTNFEEYTPLEMVIYPNMTTGVLESFETSVKMFDRGIMLGITREKHGPESRRLAMSHLKSNFTSTNRNCMFHKMRSNLYVCSQWNQLLALDIQKNELIPLIMPVVRTRNIPFMMAVRRHSLSLPKSMVEIHVSEQLAGKHSDFEVLRKLYRKELYWELLERQIRIVEKSSDEMSKYLYKPQMKFSSITEMKEESEQVWKQTLEAMRLTE
jgi:hypothetical protein